MPRKPPETWDDEMELDEVIELDDHELDVKIDDHDLDFLLMPREEGEGFYEFMETRLDQLDEENAVDEIMEELEGPYDSEDYYDDGEFQDDDR